MVYMVPTCKGSGGGGGSFSAELPSFLPKFSAFPLNICMLVQYTIRLNPKLHHLALNNFMLIIDLKKKSILPT